MMMNSNRHLSMTLHTLLIGHTIDCHCYFVALCLCLPVCLYLFVPAYVCDNVCSCAVPSLDFVNPSAYVSQQLPIPNSFTGGFLEGDYVIFG